MIHKSLNYEDLLLGFPKFKSGFKTPCIPDTTRNPEDPEERTHKNNFPENLSTSDCSEELSDKDKIVFPCPPFDTQPIEDYKSKHGDPSKLGINGENAALIVV